jgi:hypothetical protein
MRRTEPAFAEPLRGGPTGSIQCGTCGVDYGEDARASLAIDRLISSSELGRLLSNWPADAHVEVRRCHRCGRLISAKGRRERVERR